MILWPSLRFIGADLPVFSEQLICALLLHCRERIPYLLEESFSS